MKKYILIFLFLICFPILLSSCGQEEKLTNYEINIIFDDETKTLSANQIVNYVNSSENAFDDLFFHLYPNAFREGAKASVVSLANRSMAYPNGESYGKIEMTLVEIGNEKVDFSVEGEDENILSVPLQSTLFPGESVEIYMEYEVALPNINHRFGYGNSTINLANFYPIACVYDEGKGFMKELYTSNGDPFYSEIANYSVTIEYNQSLTLASSGTQTTKQDEANKITKCEASKVRDFAMVLSKDFEVLQKDSDGIQIKYFYTDEDNANDSLEISTKAVQFFSESFGKYPYKELSVVQNDFLYGGMEYPNLVMISNSLTVEQARYVIVHEIAHQWWYGVVGNNEYDEAWVDESMTEYSTALFFENHSEYGISYDTIVTNANNTFKFFYDVYKSILGEVDTSMNRSLDEFETEPEYFHAVYTQGIIMYDSLREIIGEKNVYKCFKNYFTKFSYKNVIGADLIASFSRTCGRRLDSFFESFLQGKVLSI